MKPPQGAHFTKANSQENTRTRTLVPRAAQSHWFKCWLRVRTAAAIGLALAPLGCSEGGVGQEDRELRLTQAPIVTEPESELFEPNEFPLNVCFRSNFNGNTSDATQSDRDAVRDRVQGAWGNLPRSAVAFAGWGMCPVDDTDYVKVFVGSMVTGNAPWANGTKAGIVRVSLGSTMHDVYTSIHEFGHVIGIRHEQLHPDKPPSCTSHQAGESLGANDEVLTGYDSEAIMNYCGPNGNRISSKEALFAEMAYPSTVQNHPVAAAIGYKTSNGWLVPVGSTLQTDWTRRGALPAAHPTVVWHAAGSNFTAQTWNATAGSYNVAYDFTDFRGTSHTSDSEVIVADTAKHAALTVTITS